ncbi:manganese catalase family protein [Halobacillus amylolyticus]|uniref:Manganese catalase family protein n=1 Tax=Halobacillus amylolyticus TaxID=2932259 RepID=A0ABY4H6E3_9BACI|nr:manganese catalase family protein [Halobacillus amylolyticus]UOR10436.1 manganese catalase family protein [Halobacillus amylolyticus]
MKELQDNAKAAQQDPNNVEKLQEIKDGQYVELSVMAQFFF